jgi:hypothetical protein
MTMNRRHPGIFPQLLAASQLILSGCVIAQSTPATSAPGAPGAPGAPELRDGQHDFDFNIGTWKTHIMRLQKPLTGSTTWIKLEGTVSVHKVWDGRAQMEEIEADGPAGHWEGMTLFLYDPSAHQWSQSFANSKLGVLSTPLIGEFKDGRGELYSQESFNGRTILTRAIWSDITPDSHRFEEAFSNDGGKTWEMTFKATLERQK